MPGDRQPTLEAPRRGFLSLPHFTATGVGKFYAPDYRLIHLHTLAQGTSENSENLIWVLLWGYVNRGSKDIMTQLASLIVPYSKRFLESQPSASHCHAFFSHFSLGYSFRS